MIFRCYLIPPEDGLCIFALGLDTKCDDAYCDRNHFVVYFSIMNIAFVIGV